MTTSSVWCGAFAAAYAAARPGAVAILGGGEIVTWADLARRVDAMAAALHRRGVRPGVAGTLLMRDGTAHLIATFALHRLGVPLLVLDPGDPADLNAGLVARVGGAFTLGRAADAAAAPARFLAIEEHIGGDGNLPPPPDPDATCIFARSSGTTGGMPKLAAVSHRRHLVRTLASQAAMPLGPDDRYLAMVSNAFSYGRNCMYRALATGGAVAFPPPLKSVVTLVTAIRDSRATWAAATPHHLRRLVEVAGRRPLLPHLRLLCSTAALSEAERLMVMERVSPRLYVMYGTNESGILAIAGPDDIRGKPGTVGRPPPGMRAEAADDAGRALPAGEVGTLRFAGGAFPDGYLGGTAPAAGGFAAGWFTPGDLGLVDADGHVFLKGRVDDMVNVGGRKILPADVEACLRTHPGVVEAVVVAVPDARLGAIAVALAQVRGTVTPGDLLQFCRDRMGAGHAPQAVLVAPAIPVTALGKIDRAAIAALVRERLSAAGSATP